MNDNISIEKLWYDEDFYEVQIIMSTKQIHCKINTYIVDEEINALSQKILDYVKNDTGFYGKLHLVRGQSVHVFCILTD